MKKLLIILACIFIVMHGVNAQSTEKEFYVEGYDYLEKNDLTKALNAFNQAIKLKPDYGAAYIGRAQVYLERNEIHKSIAELDKAIELFRQQGGHVRAGLAGEAFENFNRSFNDYLNNDISNAYFLRSTCYMRLDNYDKAIEDCNSAIWLNSSHSTAYENLGNIYGIRKDYDKAIYNFEKSVESDPKNSTAWLFLGYSYTERNYSRDYSRAVKCFKEYLKLSPNGEYAEIANDVIEEFRELGY